MRLETKQVNAFKWPSYCYSYYCYSVILRCVVELFLKAPVACTLLRCVVELFLKAPVACTLLRCVVELFFKACCACSFCLMKQSGDMCDGADVHTCSSYQKEGFLEGWAHRSVWGQLQPCRALGPLTVTLP